jgi:flavin reductase (DIM6/NTAB) family NADH-FMN oxidoreductase RutF
MRLYNSNDFEAFSKKFRINFFNSLSAYRATHLIGTKSKDGIDNLAIFSSIVHVGSNPPLFGVIFRPAKGFQRDTYTNIIDTLYFTINHINLNTYKQAHQTAAKYPSHISEFEQVGIKPEFTTFYAPYVKDSKIKFGLEFCQQVGLINNTILVIGRVVEVCIDPSLILEDGFINLVEAQSITTSSLDAYYLPTLLDRLGQV